MLNEDRNTIKRWQHNSIVLLAFLMLPISVLVAQEIKTPLLRWEREQLIYLPDSLGNNIPDYSWCGYKASSEAIPSVPVKVVISATEVDATKDIQKAIDYVSTLPFDENGFRGAILLEEGIFEVSGRFAIETSGVVIRGSGSKTILRATGTDRATLIRIVGQNNIQIQNSSRISAAYVPIGANEIPVADATNFEIGEKLMVERPCTQEWIDELGMNNYGGETDWLGWKPGERVLRWERTITGIEGNILQIDAPLTTAIDEKFGGGVVHTFSWPGRISKIGIENLVLESEYNSANPKDENHCWFAITMENTENAWVRQVTFRHFAGSAVALYETTSKVTVEDCISLEPVSEIAGQRRNTFFTMGQQTLFLRCYAEYGYHDFATGFMAAGPNAFVQCEAYLPNNFSGPIDSWTSGVLYDIVSIDGQALGFKNRGQNLQGAGWTAGGSMLWQCSAARIQCFAPPTTQNWAYGTWGQFAGNGLWYEANSHIRPRSLFFAQLAERLGKNRMDFKSEGLPFEGESTSSPTIQEAAEFTAASSEPPVQLRNYIAGAAERNPISTNREGAITVSEMETKLKSTLGENTVVDLIDGWLTFKDLPIFGRRLNVPWWRGEARPFEAKKAQPAITRYVPGRVGRGYTDILQEVVDGMLVGNIAMIHHNYGLWYDRRRDDHERVRRLDAEVWAPFYEQPFSRSGQGEAWDRLSKYDLTKPNSFYWQRLREFAELAAVHGKLLFHQNYFQHNILEAGAHWADSPWRPANNINNTGFPEPPPYAGDKRIYLAEQFYDLTDPIRRELHRRYIWQCLENFKGQSNVIQSLSFEYTGPLHFMEFWLDVISDWEVETGEDALVALSCTKDVQDSILADPLRSKIVDIIDIRYWAYRPDGTAYAPPGGANLAPRQHARQTKPGKRSFESVYRAVSEYRKKFPDKAVIYSEGRYPSFGWAVFMAGGSIPVLPATTDQGLLKAAKNMLPYETADENSYGLENPQGEMIMYTRNTVELEIDLSEYMGKFRLNFINPSTGKLMEKNRELMGGEKNLVAVPDPENAIIWIQKL